MVVIFCVIHLKLLYKLSCLLLGDNVTHIFLTTLSAEGPCLLGKGRALPYMRIAFFFLNQLTPPPPPFCLPFRVDLEVLQPYCLKYNFKI